MPRPRLSTIRPVSLIPWVLVAMLLGVGSAQAAIIVTGANIKNGTVTGVDVRNGSLTGADVADGRLGSADLSAGTRAALTDTSPWEKIPAGRTVRGSFQTTYRSVAVGAPHLQSFQLPALPSSPLIGTDAVNLAATSGTSDADPQCSGTFAEPTAPAGKVCLYPLYLSNLGGPISAGGYQNDVAFQELGVFYLSWTDAYAGENAGMALTWAYTAP